MTWQTSLLFGAVVAVLLIVHSKVRQRRQLAFIQAYEFHPTLKRKVKERYPHLDNQEIESVFVALRDYFLFCNQARRRMVSMPSQVVDLAWHEFILFTRAYDSFSRKAVGRFLHHTPSEAMPSPTLAQDGIKRAWRLACANEKIDPKAPHRLPRIFSIDSRLKIPDGFTYALDCKDRTAPNHGSSFCAGHIGCASGCAGDSGGSSDSGGGWFDGFGCGGDSGGGCGGD
jgi:hypothetical protein